MEELIRVVIFGAILIVGIWGLVWPAQIVAFRGRRGWTDRTGQILYGTPFRARATGLFLVAIFLAEVLRA